MSTLHHIIPLFFLAQFGLILIAVLAMMLGPGFDKASMVTEDIGKMLNPLMGGTSDSPGEIARPARESRTPGAGT